MKSNFLSRRLARRVPTVLTKREKQAIDYITACGYQLNAYSISFDVSRARVKALMYYNREEMLLGEQKQHSAASEENDASTRTRVPPAPPPSSLLPASRPIHVQATAQSNAKKHKHTHW